MFESTSPKLASTYSVAAAGRFAPHAGRTSASSEKHLEMSARIACFRGQRVDLGSEMVCLGALRKAEGTQGHPNALG
jgi:hypothetical protein